MAKRDYSNWSKEELVREIDKLEKRKKYGVVWEEKPEDIVELCKEKLNKSTVHQWSVLFTPIIRFIVP